MNHFPSVNRWTIPSSALVASLAEMARDGASGNEGVALWLGCRADGAAVITHVVVLRGRGVVKEPDLLMIDAAVINEVTDLAVEHNVCLVGQIHSHGAMFGTNLSRTDLRYGINVPYYLSVVAPDYALRPRTRIADCGVHVFEPGVGYRRLPPAELLHRIVVTKGPPVPVLQVGQ